MAVGPCTASPQKWDMSFGSFTEWQSARMACLLRCPMLAECRAGLEALPKKDQPRGMVWAGIAWGERGQQLDLEGMKRRSDRRQRPNPDTDDQPPIRRSAGGQPATAA